MVRALTEFLMGRLARAAAPQPASEALTVGVVGVGQIAAEVHLPALKALPTARVVWVADVDSAKARRVAASFRVASAPVSVGAGELPHADIVLLAVPYGARRPYYPLLARKGAAVYVEKPFARCVAEHDAHAGHFPPERIAVGYKMRATWAVRSLREIVRCGLFGGLHEVAIRFGWSGISTGGRYSSSLAMAGGGILFEVACHYLDLALHVCDAVAVEVTAGKMLTDAGFDIHTEARAVATTRHGRNVALDILATNLRRTSMDVTFRFGEGDVVLNMWQDSVPRLQVHGSDLVIELGGAHHSYPRTPRQMTHELWADFVDGVREGRASAATASGTRTTTSLIEQLYALEGG